MNEELTQTLSRYGKEFDELLLKLKALSILDAEQKLSIYDDVLYIDGTWYKSLQQITRYFLNQGREHINSYLKIKLNLYYELIKNINDYDSITPFDVDLKRELLYKSKTFLENIKLGFAVLSATYPEFKKMQETIDAFKIKIKEVHHIY